MTLGSLLWTSATFGCSARAIEEDTDTESAGEGTGPGSTTTSGTGSGADATTSTSGTTTDASDASSSTTGSDDSSTGANDESAGSTTDGPGCTEHRECEGLRCLDGGCQPLDCELDEECPDLHRCQTSPDSEAYGTCKEVPCLVDEDCAELEICQLIGGTEQTSQCEPVECKRDEHCGAGSFCDATLDEYPPACRPDTCRDRTFVGDVRISGPDSIAMLEPYDCLVGTLTADPGVTSLVGLEHVVQLQGWLMLLGLPALGSLAGLDGLRSVELVAIRACGSLSTIDALAGLERVTYSVNIDQNAMLPGLEAEAIFDDVEVGDEVRVCDNLGDEACPP